MPRSIYMGFRVIEKEKQGNLLVALVEKII